MLVFISFIPSFSLLRSFSLNSAGRNGLRPLALALGGLESFGDVTEPLTFSVARETLILGGFYACSSVIDSSATSFTVSAVLSRTKPFVPIGSVIEFVYGSDAVAVASYNASKDACLNSSAASLLIELKRDSSLALSLLSWISSFK